MKKVILDLDTGIDDAMALAYAIADEEVELLGVVGTYGNVYTEQGVQNVLNILNMLDVKNVPVYAGEECALDKDKFDRLEVSAKIHGENGVGQVEIEKSDYQKQEQDGVSFIIDSVKKYGKDLTIVATGAMTNIAKALRDFPQMSELVGEIVIMGGALTVEGNVTPFAEANIIQDPQAAKEIFESGANVVMVGLDVTKLTVLTKDHTNQWRACKAGEKYADMVDYYIDMHVEIDDLYGGCYMHDPLALSYVNHREWFKTISLPMTVITQGVAVGRTIGYNSHITESTPRVNVCIDVKADEFIKHYQNTVMKLFK